MDINLHGNIISLKEKMLEYEKRKLSVKSSSIDNSTKDKQSQKVSNSFEDIATIKKENLLAAGMRIESREDAKDLLTELKDKIKKDFSEALKAHGKINPDGVMKFYPFE